MAKQLLTETMTVRPSRDGQLFESASNTPCYLAESRDGKLIIRFPATKLDEKNENGRIYSTRVMESALNRAKNDLIQRKCLGSINDHPSEPYLAPGQASHVITEAWCDKGYLMNEAEVLNTSSGRDMKALIESGVSFGVSIRGLGSVDNQGNIMEDYEYISTDGVGNPSAKIWVQPTLIDNNSSPRIGESTSKQVSAMKTFDQAIKYVREQTVLMNNEANKIDAFRRAALVESEIAGLSLPADQLVQVFTEWDKSKQTLLGESAGDVNSAVANPAAEIEKLKSQLKIVSETYRAQIGKISSTAQGTISKLSKALEESEAKFDIAIHEAAKSRAKYQIALKEATINRKKYDIAVQEAANTVLESKKVGNKLKVVKQAYTEAVKIAGGLVNQVAVESASKEIAIKEAANLLNKLDRIDIKTVNESANVKTNALGLLVEEEDSRIVRVVTTAVNESKPVRHNSDHKVPGLI